MRAGTWKHGIYGYQHHKCKCEICREAGRVARARRNPPNDNAKIRLSGKAFVHRLTIDGRLNAVDTSTLHKWLNNDVEIYAADRWACQLGYHPYEIWGDDFYQGISTNV